MSLMNKLLMILFFFGCSQVHRIGLKDHTFSAHPKKVVWIQVAGFDLNHIGLLKFTGWNKSRGTVFTNFICTGSTWQYDLFDLRPSAYSSMYSQVTGKNNSTGNTCKDYENSPYWNVLSTEKEFDYVLIEQGANSKETLSKGMSCPQKKNWFENGYFISRSGNKKNKEEINYHYSESKKLLKNTIYQDRSCKNKRCFTTLNQVTSSLLENTLLKKSKYVIHVRDFTYLRALERGDYKGAAEILIDFENVYKLLSERYSNSELLFLITGVGGRSFNYPAMGKAWKNFENKGRGISSRSSLLSPVLSYGARSENFCGIYNQSEIFNRLFYVKKKFRLEIGN